MRRTGRSRDATRTALYALAAVAALWIVLSDIGASCINDQGPLALAAGDAGGSGGRPRLPDLPAGVDIEAGMAKAKAMSGPAEFMRLVRTEGAWDFRWQGLGWAANPYRHGGHFYYGVMSRAFGLPEWLAKRAAAVKQVYGG